MHRKSKLTIHYQNLEEICFQNFQKNFYFENSNKGQSIMIH